MNNLKRSIPLNLLLFITHRLVRVLRVLKLVNALPGLAVIVNALLIGLTSIGYIGIIIFLTFYLFAILGMLLFQNNDAFHFGTLHAAMFTLFEVATLNNWGNPVLYTQVYGCDVFPLVNPGHPSDFCIEPKAGGIVAVAYFVAFVIIGALVMLTLFVGVVTTSMEEATKNHILEQVNSE